MNATAPADFSLTRGGLLDWLWQKTPLAGETRETVRHKIIALVVLTWPPLLLLSIAEGRGWGSSVTVPFLADVQVHASLLVALPLLIFAELIVQQRMRPKIGAFLGRGLIPDHARAQYDTALSRAMRLRDSMVAEVLIIGFVYIFGVGFMWRTQGAFDGPSWYGVRTAGVLQPSLAGWWLLLVSLPLFQFLLLRWYFRLLVWGRFLWHVSRIELVLQPTDPDRCGGLGFLAGSAQTFIPVLLAQGTQLAGVLANRIFYGGATLPEFKVELIGIAALMALAILGPMVAFGPQLAAAKRAGLRHYGTVAHRYAREFNNKWLGDGAPGGDRFLGSEDIQSLADLANGYVVVKGMRVVPFTTATITQIAVATLLPVAPLMLTMFSVEQVLERLIKVIF